MSQIMPFLVIRSSLESLFVSSHFLTRLCWYHLVLPTAAENRIFLEGDYDLSVSSLLGRIRRPFSLTYNLFLKLLKTTTSYTQNGLLKSSFAIVFIGI